MGFYEARVLPHLIDFACSRPPMRRERARLVPEAAGEVLEVGFGSGLNAEHYDPGAVTRLYALEPSAGMRRRAAPRLAGLRFAVEFLDLPGEAIPLADQSVDTVVVTFTLCTIPDPLAALRGMRRVLRPDGRLLFLEHGAAPEPGVRRWQDRLNGVWGALGGGCHLNREPAGLIEAAGFRMVSRRSGYAPGTPRFAGYLTSGVAVR